MECLRVKRQNKGYWNVDVVYKVPSHTFKIRSDIYAESFMKSLIDTLDFNCHLNIVIIGIRDFDLIDSIYENLSSESNMILLEPTKESEVYIEANVQKYNKVLTSPNVVSVIGTVDEIEEKVFDIMRVNKFSYNLHNTKVITMPYMKSTYPQECSEVFNSLFDNMHSLLKLYGNAVGDIIMGVDNFINNWGLYVDGLHATEFKDAYKGRPCVIVGAGPSLDKNIQHLKDAKNHALIIAVDAALKTLVANGIVPDIVATIERSEKTFKFYRGFEGFDDVIFIGPNMIRGEVISSFKKRIFTGRLEDEFVNGITAALGYESLDIGFNVAHVPFAFGRYMKCDPMIFVGLDLAYTGGKTHTENVAHNIEGKNQYLVKENILHVKGQNGELLETFNYFMYAKKMFESYILKDRSGKYINATEGGVNILGAENMTLKEASDLIKNSTYKEKEFEELYNVIDLRNDDRKPEITEKGIIFIRKLDAQMKRIKANAYKAQKALNGHRNEVLKSIYKNAELGYTYTEDMRIPFFFLQVLVIAYNRKLRSYGIEPEEKKYDEMCALSSQYYDDVMAVSDKYCESFRIYTDILAYHKERVSK